MNTVSTTIDDLIKRAPALNTQIYDLVREIALRSKAGQRLESERLLAEKFKVSRPTVRNALDQLQAEGLIEKIHGKGSYVTKKAGASKAAVLFYSNAKGLNAGIYQRYYNGILSVVSGTRHDVLTLCNSDPHLSGPAIELIPNDVDVILTLGIMDSEYIRRLEQLGIPVITADYDLPGSKTDSVSYDTFGAGYVLTDHLISLGHTGIVFIGGYRGSETTRVIPEADSLKMQAGVEYRLRMGGIDIKPEQIRQLSIGDSAAARRLAQHFVTEQDDSTAFVFFDSTHASAFVQAARSHNLNVPTDVSLCSFGYDIADASFINAMTTAPTDSDLLGRAAGQLLFQRLENPALPPARVTLPSQLTERGTTAPPKRKA
ncbi:MAG: GntR family transcriptional regulator [Planctomycetota bacterium]